MKKNMLKILIVLSLVMYMSTNVLAIDVTQNMERFNHNEIVDTIIEGPNILNNDSKILNKSIYSIMDQDLLENQELFNTKGTDRDLWNQSYTNTYNVKKRILATNYSYPVTNAGTVTIRITNTGNSTITVNIYQGSRESNTITSGTVGTKQSREFTVGKQHGSTVCTTNICHAKQDFTISLYNVNSKIAFKGVAFIKY